MIQQRMRTSPDSITLTCLPTTIIRRSIQSFSGFMDGEVVLHQTLCMRSLGRRKRLSQSIQWAWVMNLQKDQGIVGMLVMQVTQQHAHPGQIHPATSLATRSTSVQDAIASHVLTTSSSLDLCLIILRLSSASTQPVCT